MERLSREFYRRPVVRVARALLGQKLVRVLDGRRLAGIITEVEAYLGVPDKAAHTYNGRQTARNASMWGDGGHAYVYFTYGMHYCMNIVAGKVGQPVAVLVRGLEPVEGVEIMHERRGRGDLCSGPAKLTEALGIDRSLDGVDLVESDELFVERMRTMALPKSRIVATPRIGIGYAEEWKDELLRFVVGEGAGTSGSRAASRGKPRR